MFIVIVKTYKEIKLASHQSVQQQQVKTTRRDVFFLMAVEQTESPGCVMSLWMWLAFFFE